MATNCKMLIGFIFLFCFSISLTGSRWIGSQRCPKPTDIQTDYVKNNFDVKKYQGVWYELAYHDITQPIRLCGCERSVKHYHPDTNYVFDNFTLLCDGMTQFNNLTFDLTGYPKGHMVGHWPFIPAIKFPNTVVALGVDSKSQQYRWIIEFQCVEVLERVVFTGINFYNRERFPVDGELEKMMDVARQQGLGHWMDSGLKVHVVNHTGCTYPPAEQKHTKAPVQGNIIA